MLEARLELALPCGKGILSPSCLPVPPFEQSFNNTVDHLKKLPVSSRCAVKQSTFFAGGNTGSGNKVT